MKKKKGISRILIYSAIVTGAVVFVSRQKAPAVHRQAPVKAPAVKKRSSGILKPYLLCLLAVFCMAAAQVLFPPAPVIQKNTEAFSVRIHVPSETVQRGVPVTMNDLKNAFSARLKEEKGDWAAYTKNLSTGEEIILNDHAMPSASLIKLFVAGAYFNELKASRLEHTEWAESLLHSMLSYSSNDAWVSLETLIGQGSYPAGYTKVTEFAHSIGCTDTGRMQNTGPGRVENTTSVTDVAYVLEQIYNGTYVSRACSDTVLKYLELQIHLDKIPAGVPDEEAVVANKTGELAGAEHDAAIIYGEKTDYILVIMSDDISNSRVYKVFYDLSELAFNYMEDKNEKNIPEKKDSGTKSSRRRTIQD